MVFRKRHHASMQPTHTLSAPAGKLRLSECALAGTVAITVAVVLLGIPFHAQAASQLLSEENLLDAILGRRTFEPVEQQALDLNHDGVVDIADLTFFLLRSAHLVPSVAFEAGTSKVFEGNKTVVVPLVFTKAFEAPVTLTYSLSGTATAGPKGAGGDFDVSGYDPVSNVGQISVSPGDTSAAIQVTIYDDGLLSENVETIHFTLLGGSLQTYFLGALQSHDLYIEDNDGVWTAGLEFADSSGYLAYNIELIQEDGQFTGRVLADDGVVPMPEEDDANRSGEDGWKASVIGSQNAVRIEAGPIPVADSLSFFQMHYARYFVLDVRPGQSNYQFNADRLFSGQATQILEPLRSRLGPVWPERAYLRRESTGTFGMIRHAEPVSTEEVSLEDAP